MRSLAKRLPGLLALLSFSCGTGGADIQPVVIDLTSARTPTPAASPAPAPRATPALTPPAPARPAQASLPSRRDPAAGMTPEAVLQDRVEAYNRRDLEALLALYAPDAQVYEPPDRLRDSGIEQIRRSLARRFAASRQTKATVTQRMIQGHFIVDRETETGDAGSESAVVTYEVRDGKIVKVWILR